MITTLDVLEQLGLPNDISAVTQMNVFIGAMRIFAERNVVHQDLWKEYGWRDSLMHVRSKIARAAQQANKGNKSQTQEEILDALNYLVFFLRNVQADNPGPDPQGT